MKTSVAFKAEPRVSIGKSAARAVRKEGKVPSIIYGKGQTPVNFSLEAKEVKREYHKGGFFSKIVSIELDKETFHALPKDIEVHPVSDKILHVDFIKVDEKSKINVLVPVRFLNQDRCPGIKRGGVLNIVKHDLELVCSPANIPEIIEIDLKNANIGDSIHISHITLPEEVTPAITDRDFTIATIAGRAKATEEKAEGEEGEEGEEGAEGEGETAE